MAFKRAIVTAVGPLRILIDGDTVPIPFTPKSLIDPATLAVGDVVHANLSGNRLVVLGRAGGSPVDDSGWTTPTLATGWTNSYGGDPIQYRRYGGIVYLRGRGNTTGASGVAFTLPVGFRPMFTSYWLAERFGSSFRMNVDNAGAVRQVSPSSTTILNFFSCPAFIAEE